MKGNILITGANLVLPNGIVKGDLRIKDGVISEIATESQIDASDDELVYDGSGKHLLPGELTLRFTSENQVKNSRRTYKVGLPQLPVEA